MQEVQTCYRHDDRRAGVTCQRCDRPICPDCMRQASVGFHCPECAGQGQGHVVSGAAIRQQRETPIVTNVLIALNAAVFVYGLLSGSGMSVEVSKLHVDFATVAADLVPSEIGAIVPTPGVGVAEGEWFRLVTGGFLHFGPFHLLMNMYALYVLGPQLERALGRFEFIAVYVVALLAGSAGALLLDPFAFTAGASGAIYGLFGAAVVLQRRMGIDPWKSGLVTLIAFNLVLTITLGLSMGGHVGGLIGGATAAFVVLEATVRRQPVIALVGCIGLAVGFAVLGIWAAQQAVETLHPVIDVF